MSKNSAMPSYHYNVICSKSQQSLTPAGHAALTRLFDPIAKSCGHSKTIDAKRSILHSDLETIPEQPAVQVIGNAFVPSYVGLTNIALKHRLHRTFRDTVIPDEKALDYT
jgi:xanthine dioxygenase